MKRFYACFLILLLGSSAFGQITRDFSVRFDQDLRGATAMFENTVVTCPASTSCTNARSTGTATSNDNFEMVAVDVDGVAATANSSSYTFNLPAGSTVVWAGLYGGGRSISATRNQVKIRTGTNAYQTITATQLDVTDALTAVGPPPVYTATDEYYQGFANITNFVSAAGSGSVTYTVADVRTTLGDLAGGGAYGGWGIILAYQNSAEVVRSVTVFDGFGTINQLSNESVTVSGFRTPSAGSFALRVGAIAYEGDRAITGDSLRINSANIGDTLNPMTNFFNGSITSSAAHLATKNPHYQDQLGFDIDRLDVAPATVGNNATSATLQFTSMQDQYFPGALLFSVENTSPILNVTKTVSNVNGGSVVSGDILEYTLTAEDVGNGNALNVVLTDPIPAGTSYEAGSLSVVSGPNTGAKTDVTDADQARYDAANNRVIFNLGTGATGTAGGALAARATTSVRFRVRVTQTVSGTIANQGSVTYTSATSENFTNLSDGDTATAGQQPTTVTVIIQDFGDAPDTAAATGSGNYQTLSSDGGPSHVIVGGLHLGSVAPDADVGTLQNAAATADDLSSIDDEDGVGSFPALTTASGQTYRVTVNVTNTTGSAASLVGYLDFNKDGDFLDLNEQQILSVPNGATSVNVDFTTPSGLTTGTTYARFRIGSVASEVTTPTGAASSGEVEDYLVTIVTPTDLTLSKSHTGNFTVGQTGTYSFTVNNTGGVESSGTIRVEDTLPTGMIFVSDSTVGAGWSCSASGQLVTCQNSTPVAAGGSSSFSFGINVTVATAPGNSSVTNTASVSGGGDANLANNSANAGSGDPTTILSRDMTIDKSHTGDFVRGTRGTYQITLSNVGTAPTTGTVTVEDTLPTGLTFVAGSVAGSGGAAWNCTVASGNAQALTCTTSSSISHVSPNNTSTFTFGVDVASDAPGSLINTASVSAQNEATALTGNNTDSDTATVVSFPDLTLTKTHSAAFLHGQTGVYTLTVENVGLAPTSGPITVTDTLPDGLTLNGGAAGPVSAGGTQGGNWACTSNGAAPQTITCTSSVPLAAEGGSSVFTLSPYVELDAAASVTNTASVAGGGEPTEFFDARNSASDPTPTQDGPDLTLSKSHIGDFTAGASGTYTLTVNNIGAFSSFGTITVQDTLPVGLSVNGGAAGGVPVSSTDAWTCSSDAASPQVVTCTSVVTITPESSSSFDLTVAVGADVEALSVINRARVSGGGGVNTTNNDANGGNGDPTTILAPNLGIDKSHIGDFVRGETGVYTIVVDNHGTAAAAAPLTVEDTLPAGLTFVAGSVSGANAADWSCSAVGQALTCVSGESLPVGESSTFSFAVEVSAVIGSTVTNHVEVAASNSVTINIADNEDDDVTQIVSPPELSLAKTSPESFTVGETGTYTLTLTNTGGIETNGTLTVEDTLPAGLTFVAGSVAGADAADWSCSAVGQLVTCTSTAPLPHTSPDNSSSFSFDVEVTPEVAVGEDSLSNIASVSGGGDPAPAESNQVRTTAPCSPRT